MKKSLSIICILLCLVFVLTSCKVDKQPDVVDGDKDNDKESVIYLDIDEDITVKKSKTESEQHFATNCLHRKSVNPTDVVMIENGVSDYIIVIPVNASNYITQGAGYIQNYVYESTGCTLQKVTEDTVTYDQNGKYIYVGCDNTFLSAELTMPTEALGEGGYFIKTKGNGIFLCAEYDFGLRNACLELIAQLVGFEVYSDDTIVVDKLDKVMLCDFDIVERPDIDYLLFNNNVEASTSMLMRGHQDGEIFLRVGNAGTVHNSFKYFDATGDDLKNHRKCFSDDVSQLCYTAHGDADELEWMLNRAVEKILDAMAEQPKANTVTLTQEDISSWCTCSTCTAEKIKYGTDSAVCIKFMNKLADKLDVALTEQAQQNGTKKRDMTIIFFAYMKTVSAPVRKTATGYEPIDQDVVCRDNVGVYFAAIDALYNASFYADTNAVSKNQLEGWGACTKNLYVWTYETNFSHYLYPLDTWDAMVETYRLCKTCNAKFLMSEGQFNSGNSTAFSTLKDYINYKASWDVNCNNKDIIDNFFDNYFGEASAPMKAYFTELQAHCKQLNTDFPDVYNGNIYNSVNNSKLWPKQTLDHWMDYINQAYEAIATLKGTDYDRYESLYNHILLESIFVRYAQITLYSANYTDSELYELRKSFVEDSKKVGVTRKNEGGDLSAEFNEWGF